MSGSALSDMLVETDSIGDEPHPMPVFRRQARSRRGAPPPPSRIFDLPPVDQDRPSVGGGKAEQRLGELGAPGADDAVEPDDLTRAHREGDRPEDAVAPQIANLEARLARRRGLVRETATDKIPADHRADELGLRPFAGRRGCDLEAVAQDGDAVGDGEDFVELVGDVDDRRRRAPRAAGQSQRARASRGS